MIIIRYLTAFLIINGIVSGEKFMYTNEKVAEGSIADYSLSLISPNADEFAYIDAKIDVDRGVNKNPVSIAIISIKPSNLPLINDAIGVKLDGGGRALCCNDALISAAKCQNKGHFIFDQSLVDIYVDDIVNSSTSTWENHSQPKNTGYAIWLIGDCTDPGLNHEALTFSGYISVKHNYGMLSPVDYQYLPFYQYLMISYVSFAVIWAIVNYRYRSQIMQVQQCIFCVLALCCIEMVSWYLFYSSFNVYGVRQSVPFSLSLITSSIRGAVSRMLVVAVAMGFGVSKPSLGQSKWRVLTAGAIYMILEALLLLKQHIFVNRSSSPPSQGLILLTLPVLFMDSIFYWWIFVSLADTLEDLKARRQPAKYSHMRSFAALLFGSLAVVTMFCIVRIYVVQHDLQYSNWKWMFLLFDGFAQLVYLGVLLGIAVLWRPGPNSRSIAYAEQIAQNDFDDEFELDLKDGAESPALGKRRELSQFGLGIDEDDDDI